MEEIVETREERNPRWDGFRGKQMFNEVPELGPVNTVIAEQSFAWTNSYANVRSMNGPRFNHFFHYILDMHNLKVNNMTILITE